MGGKIGHEIDEGVLVSGDEEHHFGAGEGGFESVAVSFEEVPSVLHGGCLLGVGTIDQVADSIGEGDGVVDHDGGGGVEFVEFLVAGSGVLGKEVEKVKVLVDRLGEG